MSTLLKKEKERSKADYMTALLPPNLLKLFAPRPPLPYLPPSDVDPAQRIKPKFSSVASFLALCKDHDLDYTPTESNEDRRKRIKEEKRQKALKDVEEGIAKWDPLSNPMGTEDPYNTLFVGRLNYATSIDTIIREFGQFGMIKNIVLVKDKMTGKSRGYAFIEFEKERDLKVAYKEADGMKIDGRRIVVDVERGRTVKGWMPRRLGGGLGGTRVGAPHQNQRYSGRDTGARGGSAPASEQPRESQNYGNSGGYQQSNGGHYGGYGGGNRGFQGHGRSGVGYHRGGGGYDRRDGGRRRSRSPGNRDYGDRRRY